MTFDRLLISPGVLISFAIVLVVSIVLTFFPLIGTLGFEFSIITSIYISFLCAMTSASLISSVQLSDNSRKNLLDHSGSIYFINFLILFIAYIVGLISSLLKGDCFIKEGSVFFLLIPAITVFFSTSVGLFWGYFTGKKGIFLALATIALILLYALWNLYYGISIFVYNPIFGFFPGPIYDEAIPITQTLVISRIAVLIWGVAIFLSIKFVEGFSKNTLRIWVALLLIVLIIALITLHLNKSPIGVSFSRDYVTKEVLPGSLESENFILYYDPGTHRKNDIELIALDHEWRYEQIKEAMNLKPGDKIKSYIYPDTKTRKKIIGAGETTIANPIHSEIHLIYETFPDLVLKHELVHVMAGEFGNNLLKISPKIGLLEGIAVAVDWRGQKYTPHQWSKVMIELGLAPEINDIAGFGFWYAPAEVSYTLMGSFSKYLIDAYGIEKYKTAYRTGSFTQYGVGIDELEQDWKKFLKSVDTPPETKAIAEARFSRPSIFRAKCPRKIGELRSIGYENFKDDNFYSARKNFSKALEYNGSDSNLIYWLAYSHYYDGDYSRALKITESSVPETQIEKDLLDNLRGNVKWQLGQSDEAIGIFENLIDKELPDPSKRELEIKILAMGSNSGVEENIRSFFGTTDEILQLTHLNNAISADPLFSPAYYLKGRFYYNEGEYKKAASEFIHAYLLGLSSEKLSNENLRLLGISLFAIGKYDQSKIVFAELLEKEKNEASRNYAQDFIERAVWMKKTTE